MRGRLVAFAVGVAALTLAACATGSAGPARVTGSGSTAETAAQRPSATARAGGEGFSSPVYGYSAVLPTGWTALPAVSTWDGGDIDHTADYADRFTDLAGNDFFVIGTPTDRSTDEFARWHLAWLAENRGCPAPSAESMLSLDGVPVARASVHCPDGVFGPTLVSKAMLVRDGTGLIVTSFSPDTGDDEFAPLDALVASITWSDRP